MVRTDLCDILHGNEYEHNLPVNYLLIDETDEFACVKCEDF